MKCMALLALSYLVDHYKIVTIVSMLSNIMAASLTSSLLSSGQHWSLFQALPYDAFLTLGFLDIWFPPTSKANP